MTSISSSLTLNYCLFVTSFSSPGPSTWALAIGKNDMMTILISKLIDDGISLYKVGFVSLLRRWMRHLWCFLRRKINIKMQHIDFLML